MNCYKVKVKYPAYNKNQTEGINDNIVVCEYGTLYVFGESFSDVESIVKYDHIESIERLGVGYVSEQQ